MKRLALLSILVCAPVLAQDPVLAKERVILRTGFGNMVIALYPKVAPETVKQFLKMVRAGIYDSTHFFRIHPGFVAQTTDANGRLLPLTPEQRSVLKKIPGEFSALPHVFGTVSMAHYDGDPNSGEVSFSILLGTAPHLDGKYTVFGEVEMGREILSEIQRIPRVDGTVPTERVVIEKAMVVDSAEALAKSLKEPLPRRELASIQTANAHPGFLAPALILLILVNILAFLLRNRMLLRSLHGMLLVNLLISVFALVLSLGPQSHHSTWIGFGLCILLLSTFRLLSRFETT